MHLQLLTLLLVIFILIIVAVWQWVQLDAVRFNLLHYLHIQSTDTDRQMDGQTTYYYYYYYYAAFNVPYVGHKMTTVSYTHLTLPTKRIV